MNVGVVGRVIRSLRAGVGRGRERKRALGVGTMKYEGLCNGDTCVRDIDRCACESKPECVNGHHHVW